MVTHTYECREQNNTRSLVTLTGSDTIETDARALEVFSAMLLASAGQVAVMYTTPVVVDTGVQLELLADEWRPDKPVTVYRIVRLNTQEQPNDE
jgi:hypothetical protein